MNYKDNISMNITLTNRSNNPFVGNDKAARFVCVIEYVFSSRQEVYHYERWMDKIA